MAAPLVSIEKECFERLVTLLERFRGMPVLAIACNLCLRPTSMAFIVASHPTFSSSRTHTRNATVFAAKLVQCLSFLNIERQISPRSRMHLQTSLDISNNRLFSKRNSKVNEFIILTRNLIAQIKIPRGDFSRNRPKNCSSKIPFTRRTRRRFRGERQLRVSK